MFKLQGALPTDQSKQLSSIILSHPFPPYTKDDEKFWSLEQYEELKKLWQNFKGPVRDITHFVILHEYGELDDLELFSAIIFMDGEIYVDVFDEYDVKDMAEYVTTVDPVEQKKAPPSRGPNAPCHCGSGKKLKKCCRT